MADSGGEDLVANGVADEVSHGMEVEFAFPLRINASFQPDSISPAVLNAGRARSGLE